MTNKTPADLQEALKPCPVPFCKDNRVTTGYENGPNLFYVQCASPEHVLKVYGFTQVQAGERWNKRN